MHSTDGVKSTSNHVSRLSFKPLKCTKIFNKRFEFLLYKTNRLHFPVRVYYNRSQKTSQCVKNNSHATRLYSMLASFLFLKMYNLFVKYRIKEASERRLIEIRTIFSCFIFNICVPKDKVLILFLK